MEVVTDDPDEELWWSYPDGGFFAEPVPSDRIEDGWIVEKSRARPPTA
jgi:hypothetical protein